MTPPALSRMTEDYLTLIWKAYEWPGPPPSTTDLATSLGVGKPTVSANLKKLAREGYLEYEPYGAIGLTELGRVAAVAVVRRHRLLETYLVEQLGFTWDEVHDEADLLEHAVSDAVLDRMDRKLGHPRHDPHGDPIPTPDGELPPMTGDLLTQVALGARVLVVRVSDREPAVLRYLEGKRVVPHAVLTTRGVDRAAGVMTVEIGGTTDELTVTAAEMVLTIPAI
jgi:DtxR family Mn-dependent transcriptional regulator